ncbi:AfsR/SARP family transcriptional regulator [Micromonospora sp. C95]|uniref:AfsR/SARP family transcriptional regulator n=1 Tax=Micromonospora sp. C95 TaxID=2824882 RepID=UPI001B3726EA|nr:AfsR/SARP family transcriptional regulator [Micromonospora sp. C95]MBQ1023941.1 AAA family ATPase [Micromonospora sp. C95]
MDDPARSDRGAKLEFRLLGPVELLVNGRSAPLNGGMQRGLLAVLLLHANRTVSADHLRDVLWGGHPPRTAKASLQWQISQLRKLLDRADPGADRLLFRQPGYVLRVEPGELDIDRFVALADEGRASLADGDLVQADKLLSAVVGLWRGEALEDAEVPGLCRERSHWNTSYMSVVEDRLDVDLRLGRHHSRLRELNDLVAANPLRERLREMQMLALYRAGDPSGAVQSFHDGRAALAEELGLEPGEQLQRLFRAVLARDPALDVPAPAVAAPPAVPAELPADVPDFVGRRAELAALTAARDSGNGRDTPIVLTGPAGCGKTALLVHWARANSDLFPHGQFFADMRGHSDEPPAEPLRVLGRFLRALGVAASDLPDRVDEAAGHYRSLLSGRRMLIVLDDVRSPEQVRPLFPGSDTCLLVMTSRNRLSGLRARDGARHLELGGMTEADARELLTHTVGASRVTAEPEAAEELIRLCSRLPLAIRIAATRMADDSPQPVADILDGLRGDDGLCLLEVEADSLASMRLSLDHSYSRLEPSERQLLRRLGTDFSGLVTPWSVAERSEETEGASARALTALAEANLIKPVAPDRYEVGSLMRLYAMEQNRREQQASCTDTRLPERADN